MSWLPNHCLDLKPHQVPPAFEFFFDSVTLTEATFFCPSYEQIKGKDAHSRSWSHLILRPSGSVPSPEYFLHET